MTLHCSEQFDDMSLIYARSLTSTQYSMPVYEPSTETYYAVHIMVTGMALLYRQLQPLDRIEILLVPRRVTVRSTIALIS
jgi:hypothetical protein